MSPRKVQSKVAENRNRRIVARCPACDHKLTYKNVKTLWGRAANTLSHTEDRDESKIAVACTHCDAALAFEQVKSLWGNATGAVRTTFGAGPGRPKSKDRCPCEAMTKERAAKRNHVCTATTRKKAGRART